jgi:hypothetical protein
MKWKKMSCFLCVCIFFFFFPLFNKNDMFYKKKYIYYLFK